MEFGEWEMKNKNTGLQIFYKKPIKGRNIQPKGFSGWTFLQSNMILD